MYLSKLKHIVRIKNLVQFIFCDLKGERSMYVLPVNDLKQPDYYHICISCNTKKNQTLWNYMTTFEYIM